MQTNVKISELPVKIDVKNTDLLIVQDGSTTNVISSENLMKNKVDKATTLDGYGITDAKIDSGVITLGSNTITPLTTHQDISGKADKATTLDGYGITDAKLEQVEYYNKITLGDKNINLYTKDQIDSGLASKLDVFVGTEHAGATVTFKVNDSGNLILSYSY